MKAPAISKGLQRRFSRLREQRGQMLALLAVSIVAMCAAGAFVMDVGSWFRAHRATQSVADASALAGAQELPVNTPQATSCAALFDEERRRSHADQLLHELLAHGHDHGAGTTDRAGLPLQGARHLVGQRGRRLRRTRVQPRIGEVRRAVRCHQDRADAERLRRPMLRIRLSDNARSPEGRPRLVQDHQHRRLAGRRRAQHPRRLDLRRTQRHDERRLVLGRPGCKVQLVRGEGCDGRPHR